MKFKGELKDVVLINFSIDKKEIAHLLPPQLESLELGGRALISMVNVDLHRMRPGTFLPAQLGFNYRHVAFRLLLDDSAWNSSSSPKGIWFYKSFTNNPLIVWGGRMLTDYHLGLAKLKSKDLDLELRQGDCFLNYTLDLGEKVKPKKAELKAAVGAIDRAYATHDTQIWRTQILREKWPLKEVACTTFETNFFESAKLESAYIVPETIYYTWQEAVRIQ